MSLREAGGGKHADGNATTDPARLSSTFYGTSGSLLIAVSRYLYPGPLTPLRGFAAQGNLFEHLIRLFIGTIVTYLETSERLKRWKVIWINFERRYIRV